MWFRKLLYIHLTKQHAALILQLSCDTDLTDVQIDGITRFSSRYGTDCIKHAREVHIECDPILKLIAFPNAHASSR
jgi:hypothetical protein